MKNLDLHLAAQDFARATLTNDALTFDTALAAKAGDLGLTTREYAAFKAAVTNQRNQLLALQRQDGQLAKAAELKAKAAKPAPPTAPQ